jgi:phytoene/squalene synthetase
MSAEAISPSPAGMPTEDAYHWCHDFVLRHASGDPLASMLRLPALRRPAEVVYAFARHSFDLSVQPNGPAQLDAWHDDLLQAFHGAPRHPIHVALLDLARTRRLPITPLLDLIAGARAQATGGELATFEAVVEHARTTAGPIARLLLHVSGCDDTAVFALGENFAIGLRLLDDLVDRATDVAHGHRRVARADLTTYGVEMADLLAEPPSPAAAELLALWAVRARMYLRFGQPLSRRAPESLRPLVTGLLRLALRTSERIEAEG